MLEWLHIKPEATLLAVAIILYVHDLATPLFANEILFFRSGNGRWLARPAGRYPEFRRRYLALVRPLRPGTTVVRATWPRSLKDDACRARALDKSVATVEGQLVFLRYQCTVLLLTLFAGLPCLYIFSGPAALLLGIGVVYLQAFAMAGSLLARRKTLQLPWRTMGFVLFESLVCIPYAVNLYRKIIDRLVPIDADPADLAAALLSADASAELRRELLRSLEQRLALGSGGDAKQDNLVRYRQRLLGESR